MAGHSTLSVMERVLFLHQVPLFADLDPSDLAIETRVNGEVRQSARTSHLTYGPAALVEFITTFTTLCWPCRFSVRWHCFSCLVRLGSGVLPGQPSILGPKIRNSWWLTKSPASISPSCYP